MRSFLRGAAALLLAFVCILSALFLRALRDPPVFEGEGYELCFGTSSGEIVRTDMPALMKALLPNVRGESARFSGDRYAQLKEDFCAELLFTEHAAGVDNYYLYSPKLGQGIFLRGNIVNLHIAVSENGTRTAAGTPIIFGGF